jgi:histidyl-tRNA synthetase
MAQKPSIPKGTRDFGPGEMLRRNYIFAVIRRHFERYGFKPIETPAMESLSTLLGKYGEEGDKLLFRILNSGDFLQGIPAEYLTNDTSRELSGKISEKGLRYDLTVPFARFVVQHRNELTFPFRRYQIQAVWRADRPQKGRYREFYQCDADMIGSESLLNEAELIKLIDEVFGTLNLSVSIRVNNRKILAGIAEVAQLPDKLTDITVAIDKLDKIGLEGVVAELRQKGIPEASISTLMPLFETQGENTDKLSFLRSYLQGSVIGNQGINEMEQLLSYAALLKPASEMLIDLTLARGLNYYTGVIIEVVSKEVSFGSICGGGRYDNLTGVFGMEGISGVGISFGADRIYDVLMETQKFPQEISASTQVLIANFGEHELPYALDICRELRESGVDTEIYPEASKIKKQFAYADANKIPLVLIAGEEEMRNQSVALKNMQSGEQIIIDKDRVCFHVTGAE